LLRQRLPSTAKRPAPKKLGIAATIVVAGLCLPAPAVACGYHNPADLALGLMNWMYPKAFYVRTAVWQAEDAGILPPRPRTQVKDLFAFNRILKHLKTLGDNLNAVAFDESQQSSFAIVHLDSMLWTRFAATPDGYTVETHATGPKKGDVVVVTDGKVIMALANGSLSAGDAEKFGLMRYYGPDHAQAIIRLALAAATAKIIPSSQENAAAE